MVWQDIVLFPGPHVDVEQEREARLAAQAKAGADWALSALIARYQPVVIRYLTRLTGDSTRASTLAERIFVRMERRIRGPHGAQHLRLWLLRASTETGLDSLRNPQRAQPARLQSQSPRGLLAERAASSRTTQILRESLNRITGGSGSTSRQVRPLVWAEAEENPQDYQDYQAHVPPLVDDDLDRLDPREALRHKLVRAVLAELPYGDAQCLALHLVAGLNQSEVAQALGIRPSATRHRIVQGLQLFARRYDAALVSLGISTDISFDEPAGEDDLVPAHELDRGEDFVIPRAAASPRSVPDDEVMPPQDLPTWQRPSQHEPVDLPQAGMQAQNVAQHSVITMDIPPSSPDMDGVASGEALTDERPYEHRAIPVAESAIVGPIIDAVPVAATDVFSPTMQGFQEHDTRTLSYTVLVDEPRIVEAALAVQRPVEATPVSWQDTADEAALDEAASGTDDAKLAARDETVELASEADRDAGTRVVPVLSSEGATIAFAFAASPVLGSVGRDADDAAAEAARLIPILSHEHEDGDLHSSM